MTPASTEATVAPAADTESPWVSDEASTEPSIAEIGEVRLDPTQPARILGLVGGGFSLRLVQNLDFAQGRFAPGYVDAFGAYVFPNASRLRHGVGLGIATNTAGDGSVSLGINPFEQFVAAPTYVAYYRWSDGLVFLGRAAVPLSLVMYRNADDELVTEGASVGLELGGGAAYLLTAGLGLSGQLVASVYAGAESSVHPAVSAGFGAYIDYEVLP